jgi:hypothetical protein
MKMHLQLHAYALPTKNLVNPAVMFQDSVCATPLYAFYTSDLHCNLCQYVGLCQYVPSSDTVGGAHLLYCAKKILQHLEKSLPMNPDKDSGLYAIPQFANVTFVNCYNSSYLTPSTQST